MSREKETQRKEIEREGGRQRQRPRDKATERERYLTRKTQTQRLKEIVKDVLTRKKMKETSKTKSKK